MFLVFFNSVPAFNILCMIISNIVTLYLIFKIKPYKEKKYMIRDGITEASFILIHIITFPLLKVEDLNEDNYNNIGVAIVVFCCFILLAHFSILMFE